MKFFDRGVRFILLKKGLHFTTFVLFLINFYNLYLFHNQVWKNIFGMPMSTHK